MTELSELEFEKLQDHIRDGHTEIVLQAMDRNRDLLARADELGWTLVHSAGYFGRLDLFGELSDRGADIHATT